MPVAEIHKAIVTVMREVGAIAKDAKNTEQGYAYRSTDAVYNQLHPLLAKHGIFTVPEVLEESRETGQTRRGGTLHWSRLRVKYTFFAGDGSSIETIVQAEGMDSGDKATAKAMTVAHRYALCQIFAIPLVNVDPETQQPEWYRRDAGLVTTAELNSLKRAWLAAVPPDMATEMTPDARRLAFAKWAADQCGESFDASSLTSWTRERYQKCQDALTKGSDHGNARPADDPA